MRKIIIGDVHGNYLGVQSILKKVEYNPSNDILIFVGDYVDHLPSPTANVKNTIEYLVELNGDNVHFLLGNHDQWFIEWISQGNVPAQPIWYKQGGGETLQSYDISWSFMYNEVVDRIPRSHLDFFNSLEQVYIDDDIVVVHGGFSCMDDIDNAAEGLLTAEAIWDRTFHKFEAPVHILNHYKKVFGDRLFICGHSPWGPLYNDNHGVKRQLIDGGSKGGGYLYAAIVEDNQVIEIVKE